MAKASIGVRELKDQLSATLARVRRGQSIVVTDRNEPVALLVPIRARDREELLKTLTRSGRVAWAGGKPAGLAKPPRVRGRPVSDAVREDRR
jgi:prevent-host-death family protein